MVEIFHSDKKYIYFLFILFILWIVLFEFILAPNQILPRPSIILVSFFSLFRDYQFLNNLLLSISAIYFSFIASYLFFWSIRRYLIHNKNLIGFISFSVVRVSGIIPGILAGLFLIVWFPNSEGVKYIFVFLSSFIFLVNRLEYELKKVNSDYIDSIVSLGAGRNFISEKVIWKAMEPGIAKSLNGLNLYLWTMLIVFELIKGESGIGSVLKMAIIYKDVAVLFSCLLIIGIIILTGDLIIKIIRNKYFFWSLD